MLSEFYSNTDKGKMLCGPYGQLYNHKKGKKLWFAICLCVFNFLVFLNSSNAYDPPIGIPDPGNWVSTHPIDSSAPAQPGGWPGSEVVGYYYIDITHGSATDTGNPYGYPDKPRRNIPTTYPAGSYVEVHGGPYTGGGTLYIVSNGTAANPVWFKGTPGSLPEFQRVVNFSGTYLIAEYLNITNNYTLQVNQGKVPGTNTNNICVRNCTVTGTGANVGNNSAISTKGDAAHITHDIVLFNNMVSFCGDSETDAENDFHALNVGGYIQNVWVLENEAHHNGGDGIQCSHNANFTADHIYIGKNYFHDDGENAIDIKEANDVIISQNRCHDYEPRSSSPGEAIVIHFDPDNIWVLFNEVYNARLGIITTGSTNTWFISNLIYNTTNSAMRFRGGTDGGAINNTVHNHNNFGIIIESGTVSYEIHNNIFSNRSDLTDYDIYIDNSSVSNVTNIDNCMFYYAGGNANINWAGTVYSSISGFRTGTGECLNCIDGEDPLFINAAANDFSLQSNSPAKDAGTTTEHLAYTSFFSRYGIDISKDIDGKPRPLGKGWDIGAYEAGGAGTGPQLLLLLDE